MKTVVISGGSGTIGRRLTEVLSDAGYKSLSLTRNAEKAKLDHYIHWDPSTALIDDQYAEADIVVNLAGAGIADGRWTKGRKRLIMDSRLQSTELLIQIARDRGMRLDSFISASAIGYYGDGGDRWQTEDDAVMTEEFLSEVCVAWEEAAAPARDMAEYVAILRIGTVLSPTGGALDKMDMTLPMGIASYLGRGKQWMSWIHIDDLCKMILYCIQKRLDGVYNAVSPDPRTNKEFTQVLRDTINPKALVLPAPALGIKLAFGEMSRVVLNSNRVSADKIIGAGMTFDYANLEKALGQLYEQ